MSTRFKPGARTWSLLAFAAMVLVWALCIPHLRVSMSITHFLPKGESGKVEELLHALAESDLSKISVVDLSGGEADQLLPAARALGAELARRPSVQSVQSGLGEADQAQLHALLGSVPSTAFLDAETVSPAATAAALERLKGELGGAMGPLVAQLAPRDPYGATLQLFAALRAMQGGQPLASQDGILTTEAGDHAFFFVTSRASAFDADAQRAFLADLDAALEASRTSPEQRLELSSVARFTVASEQGIRGDIERIGTLSTAGILLLFAFFFRSPRMLLLCLVPLACGTMAATVVTMAVFGQVHGITLAFGSSLLGVGIDYAEHYFSHFALEPERGAHAVMRSVRPALVLGALTTTGGLLGLAWADFPSALEMAVFSAVAVLASMLSTLLLLPPWMPSQYRRPPWPHALERIAERLLTWLGRRRHVWPVLAALALLSLGVTRLRFLDDPSALVALDPALMAEDSAVRARITQAEPGRFAIVVGEDREAATLQLEAATRELEQARQEGKLGHYAPLGSLLHSATTQRQAYAAARAGQGDFARAAVAAGFQPQAFAPYIESLQPEEPVLVDLEALRASPLGALVGPLAPTLGSRQAFVLPLGGVVDVAALQSSVHSATIIDEPALLIDTYRHVRTRVLQLVAINLVVVLLLLLARYRSLGLALAALVPALLAALLTFALFAWCGVAVQVLHAVGLVLVLAMGVDFGIFAVEARGSTRESAQSLVSMFTATLTTLLSFGLLAASASPALRALGSTMTLGLVFSLLLCPLTLTVWRKTTSP